MRVHVSFLIVVLPYDQNTGMMAHGGEHQVVQLIKVLVDARQKNPSVPNGARQMNGIVLTGDSER